MRKISLAIMLIVMMSVVTACGSQGNKNNSDNKSSETNDTKAVDDENRDSGNTSDSDDTNTASDNQVSSEEDNVYVEEKEPVKSLAELAAANDFLEGVMLRDKMTYECIEELKAKTIFSLEDFKDWEYYLEETEDISVSSYEEIPDIFQAANDSFQGSYGSGPFPIITIAKDMTLDNNLIINDSGYRTNPNTTLRYGLLVVPSGVTLTLTNDLVLTLSDMAYGYSFLLIKNGGSVVVEYGQLDSYRGVYIEEGGSLTIHKGIVSTSNFINNGDVTVDAEGEDQYYTALSVDDKFFNGESATIKVRNKGRLALRAPQGGIYNVPYSSEEYGDTEHYEYRMGYNAPFGYNKGVITISEGASLNANSTDIGSEGMPFVNDGEMVILAGDIDGGDYAAYMSDFHFQNYGMLKLQGEDKNSGRVFYAYSSLIENYGTISFEQEGGCGLYLYGTNSSPEEGYTYLINYAGGTLNEKNSSLQNLYLESYARFFDNVTATNQIAVMNPALALMTARESWEGVFSAGEDEPVHKENYVRIGYNSGDEMSFSFTYMNGDDYFGCYSDFLLTSVSGYSVIMTASSSDFPGEYPVTVTMSEDFQSLTYTIEDTKYGTLTATVPRQEASW